MGCLSLEFRILARSLIIAVPIFVFVLAYFVSTHLSPPVYLWGTIWPFYTSDHLATSDPMSNGKLQVGYFSNWGIYGRKFPPALIPAESLT